MGSIKINNTQAAYDQLIKTIKKEFEWYRQWTCAEEGESYKQLIKLGRDYWPGNNRKLWFIGDGNKSLDRRLDTINCHVVIYRDDIFRIIDGIYAKASSKGGELYGNCKVKTKGYNNLPTILDGDRTAYKHIDNSDKRGFASDAGYKAFRNQFVKMFDNVKSSKNATVSLEEIKAAWKVAFGNDSTDNVKNWNKVQAKIKETNNYVKKEANKTFTERDARLKEFHKKWKNVEE